MSGRTRLLRFILCSAVLAGALGAACGDVPIDAIVRAAPEQAACANDGDCDAGARRCNLAMARCVECVERADCSGAQACRLPAGRCVAGCEGADSCGGTEPACDETTGLCRACASDAMCPEDARRCDESGACFSCLDSNDCEADSDEPFCNASRRCVECLTDGHCDDSDERCSLVLGKCARPCSTALSCGSSDPFCDLAIGFCVECQEDLDCDADEHCRGSECVD